MTGGRGTAPAVPAAPRAIVVGAGLMGRWHAHAVTRCGRRVAAVVDADAGRARALAARHEGAVAATTLREALSRAAAGDVVHVCTPLDAHLPLAMEALDGGCHVLVEKPAAPTAPETAALLARAEATGRMLVPVHQYPFQEGALRAARILRSLGAVLHVDAVACTAGADGRGDDDRERLAVEVLPHPLSLLARLVDVRVDEPEWSVLRPRAGELRVSGTLAGATVAMLVSTHGRPTRNTLTIVCEGGTLSLDLFHGFATLVSGQPTRAFKAAHPFVAAGGTLLAAGLNLGRRLWRAEPAYPGLRELVCRTYAAAGAAMPVPPVTSAETLAVARALDRIAARRAAALPARLAGRATLPLAAR